VTNSPSRTFTADESQTGTILTALRQWLPGQSWSAVRKLLQSRRVAVNGVLCLDEARRLARGETVTIAERTLPVPPGPDDVTIRFVDRTIVVVEKPSGMVTVRRTSELNWSQHRRGQQPTLDETVPRLIARHAARRSNMRIRSRPPRLFAVHRIDRDTSGLLVFARHESARRHIIQQFAQHDAARKYLALIPGQLPDQTIRSQLIRDRGDGLRGSTPDANVGQHAVTHVKLLRRIRDCSELECRLETGRTNQIRIHLAELGHPICGDIKYRGPFGQPMVEDTSGSPRLALHAAQLRFVHPETGEFLHYDSPWPAEMRHFLTQLQLAAPPPRSDNEAEARSVSERTRSNHSSLE
jgi:23S rRNA pseudouridine1911/1915/1917 synthase